MQGKTQSYYTHALLQEEKVKKQRINVTFRTIYPNLATHRVPQSEPLRVFEPKKVRKYPAGEIEGIEPGTIFKGRFSIWEAGVHGVHQGAICSNSQTGAISILVATNDFNIDEESRIIFAGSGGDPNQNHHPTKAQKLLKKNLGMLVSMIRKTPLRVVRLIGNTREKDEEFMYCGANFYVTMVYSKLVQIPHVGPVLMWFFVVEQSPPQQLPDKTIDAKEPLPQKKKPSYIAEILDDIMRGSVVEHSFGLDDPIIKPFLEQEEGEKKKKAKGMTQPPQVFQDLSKEGTNKLFLIRFVGERLRIFSRPACETNMLMVKLKRMDLNAAPSPNLAAKHKKLKVEGPDLATSSKLNSHTKKPSSSTSLKSMLLDPDSKTKSIIRSIPPSASPSGTSLTSSHTIPTQTAISPIKSEPPSPPNQQANRVACLVPCNNKPSNILPTQNKAKNIKTETQPSKANKTIKPEPPEDLFAHPETSKKRPLTVPSTSAASPKKQSHVSATENPPSSSLPIDTLPEPKKKRQKAVHGPTLSSSSILPSKHSTVPNSSSTKQRVMPPKDKKPTLTFSSPSSSPLPSPVPSPSLPLVLAPKPKPKPSPADQLKKLLG